MLLRSFLSIGAIVFAFVTGVLLRRGSGASAQDAVLPPVLSRLRTVAIYGINPFTVASSLWIMDFSDRRLFLLPFLYLLYPTAGGLLGVLFSKLLRHEPAQRGAYYACATFSLLGFFASPVCYALFGEKGFALSSFYRMGEELYYFGIGFPVSRMLGQGKEGAPAKFVFDKHVLIFIAAFVTGLALNFGGVPRPAFFSTLVAICVPLSVFLSVLPTGYKLNIKKVRGYRRDCLAMCAIKFVLLPAIMLPVFYIAGLWNVQGGMVIRVLLILSCAPCGIVALIPPQLYGLDGDLANSCWLVTAAVFAAMVPFFLLFLR